jgi:hypothetical protein
LLKARGAELRLGDVEPGGLSNRRRGHVEQRQGARLLRGICRSRRPLIEGGAHWADELREEEQGIRY